jgi:hypothetical protein
MKTFVSAVFMTLILVAGEAPAADVAMHRVLSCEGPDAKMEVYIPYNAKLDKPVVGAYSLDLTDAGKGKALEPVRVQYSSDKKSVIIDQYTRKLPRTMVAIEGATVDFDKRFGTRAKCGPFDKE